MPAGQSSTRIRYRILQVSPRSLFASMRVSKPRTAVKKITYKDPPAKSLLLRQRVRLEEGAALTLRFVETASPFEIYFICLFYL